jgi:hypothetical protein
MHSGLLLDRLPLFQRHAPGGRCIRRPPALGRRASTRGPLSKVNRNGLVCTDSGDRPHSIAVAQVGRPKHDFAFDALPARFLHALCALPTGRGYSGFRPTATGGACEGLRRVAAQVC